MLVLIVPAVVVAVFERIFSAQLRAGFVNAATVVVLQMFAAIHHADVPLGVFHEHDDVVVHEIPANIIEVFRAIRIVDRERNISAAESRARITKTPSHGRHSSQTQGPSATVCAMRIIAGEFRGRKILPPVGEVTRPITDRVKQSVFDILSPRIEEATVYDCFSGTGSMGLECLSRGAKHAVFFEVDRPAVTRLKDNLKTLNCADRATIITQDIFRFFKGSTGTICKADLLFLDPPYRYLNEKPRELVGLAESFASTWLNSDGIVIFRHDAADHLDLPPLVEADRREYGSMIVRFLSRANNDTTPSD